MVADRTGQTGIEAGGYGKRLRVGLHFTQPNLLGSLSKWHSGSVPFLLLPFLLLRDTRHNVGKRAAAVSLKAMSLDLTLILATSTRATLTTSSFVGCSTSASARSLSDLGVR